MSTTDPERARALASTLVESEVARQMMDVIARAVANRSKFVSDNTEFFASLARMAEDIRTWPKWQRELLAKAALNGWYVNWHTPITINKPIAQDKPTLDAFMVGHLTQDWNDIVSSIVSAVPERREVISCAFELHKERRYIASIPLFLAQADGVCAEYLGAHLFTDKEQREEQLAKLQASNGVFAAVVLQPLGLHTQFGAGISKSSRNRKKLAPNRNGILHGSRKHLDYGTEINSLKAFSLLAFVVYVLTGKHDSIGT